MFNRDQFIADCIQAVDQGQGALLQIMDEAVTDPSRVISELGDPTGAGLVVLHRSPRLTILNFAWAPCMSMMPHNHRMFSVVGIYSGREDSVLWQRKERRIEAAGATSLGAGETGCLGKEAIHSVLNPTSKLACALHMYGGDFFEPPEPRSEWDPETLVEKPWDMEKAKSLFQTAEARFKSVPQ